MRTSRVVSEVRRFVKEHGLAGGGVVAVSGGADSVATLRALREAGRRPLTVAHLNHQLRGADSDADEAFVCDLTASLGLAFRSTRIDVAATAREAGDNLEATARRVRYDWLMSVAGEVDARWIATGHTVDDQAETILHRLIRGTGLQGLRGIAAVTTLQGPGAGLSLFRPLLSVTRQEILDYLSEMGQRFREDLSNVDPRFTRNRIRAELLPLLKTFNPEVVPVLRRLAGQAEEAHALLLEQARSLLERAERPRAGDRTVLDPGSMTAPLPRIVVRAMLRLVWEREDWPMGEMGFEQWEHAVAVARRESGGWDFPGGVFMKHGGHAVLIGRRSE